MLQVRVGRLVLLGFAVAIQALILQACDWPWDAQFRPPPTVTSIPLPLSSAQARPHFANVTPGPFATQAIEDVTVGVQPLLADANRVAIEVNVVSPPKPYRNSVSLGWSDYPRTYIPVLSSGGTNLPYIDSWAGSKVFESGEQITGTQVLYFDASNLTDSRGNSASPVSPTVPLSLSLPVYLDNNPSPFLPNATAAPVVGTPPPTPLPSHLLSFIFQLSIPFDSDRILVPVGQTAEDSDVAFTLDQVDVTTSETRFYLHFRPVQTQPLMYDFNWAASAELGMQLESKPDDIMLQPGLDGGASCNSDSSCIFNYTGSSLLSATPAIYRLTVNVFPDTAPCCGGEMKPLGTWVFHFIVPAFSRRK